MVASCVQGVKVGDGEDVFSVRRDGLQFRMVQVAAHAHGEDVHVGLVQFRRLLESVRLVVRPAVRHHDQDVGDAVTVTVRLATQSVSVNGQLVCLYTHVERHVLGAAVIPTVRLWSHTVTVLTVS